LCGIKTISKFLYQDDRINHLHNGVCSRKLQTSNNLKFHFAANIIGLVVPREYDEYQWGETKLEFHIPVFMVFMNLEDDITKIAKYWSNEIGMCPLTEMLDKTIQANRSTEKYILTLNYSCSICGMEYDSINNDICEEHIRACISAHSSK